MVEIQWTVSGEVCSREVRITRRRIKPAKFVSKKLDAKAAPNDGKYRMILNSLNINFLVSLQKRTNVNQITQTWRGQRLQ